MIQAWGWRSAWDAAGLALARRKAMRLPSGEIAGCVSLTSPFVRRRGRLPLLPTCQRWRWYLFRTTVRRA